MVLLLSERLGGGGLRRRRNLRGQMMGKRCDGVATYGIGGTETRLPY